MKKFRKNNKVYYVEVNGILEATILSVNNYLETCCLDCYGLFEYDIPISHVFKKKEDAIKFWIEDYYTPINKKFKRMNKNFKKYSNGEI